MKHYAELKKDDGAPAFLEATAYSKDRAVIQIAEMVDAPVDDKDAYREFKRKTNSINYFWKPFYYKHVEKMLDLRVVDDRKDRRQLSALKSALSRGQRSKIQGVEVFDEYIPLKHYYHRFTRSIFWEIEDMIPFANHWIYRTLWGWMGAPEVALLKLFQGPVIRKASVYAHVVQESIMPVRRVPEGIENFDRWFGVYPLLLFPIRVYKREPSGLLNPAPEDVIPGENYGLYVDIGAYGAPLAVKQGEMWDAKKNVRDGEHWTRSVHGFSAPYVNI
jgi:Delta24-sterol reductase